VLPTKTFQSCRKLAQLTLPREAFLQDGNNFEGTTLRKFDATAALWKAISPGCFKSSQVEVFVFPRSLRRICRLAFSGTRLAEVDLRATKLREVQGGAFARCPCLRIVRLGGNVLVEDQAFGTSSRLTFFEVGEPVCFDRRAFAKPRGKGRKTIISFVLRGSKQAGPGTIAEALADDGFVRSETFAFFGLPTSPIGARAG
jgi:hypothetical protein